MNQTTASRTAAPGGNMTEPDGAPCQEAAAPRFGEFLRFFLKAMRPWRWVYAGMFAGVLIATAAGYALPIFQKRLIDVLTLTEGRPDGADATLYHAASAATSSESAHGFIAGVSLRSASAFA